MYDDKNEQKKKKENSGSTDCNASKGDEKVITRLDEQTVSEQTCRDTLKPYKMQEEEKSFAFGGVVSVRCRKVAPGDSWMQVRIFLVSVLLFCFFLSFFPSFIFLSFNRWEDKQYSGDYIAG